MEECQSDLFIVMLTRALVPLASTLAAPVSFPQENGEPTMTIDPRNLQCVERAPVS